MSNGVNEDGEIYHEFWNSPYEYQKEHLLKTQTLFKEKLNITSHTFGAPGNAIDSNTVKNHVLRGIAVVSSGTNTIVNNTFQASFSGWFGPYISPNTWDNGYPSGGNYWSDYEVRYPDARELDGSGIWDTPYFVDF